MIYRKLGFLAVVRFGSSPTPCLSSPVSKLSLCSSVSPVQLTDERGLEEVGEEPNHTMVRKPDPLLFSILSDNNLCRGLLLLNSSLVRSVYRMTWLDGGGC